MQGPLAADQVRAEPAFPGPGRGVLEQELRRRPSLGHPRPLLALEGVPVGQQVPGHGLHRPAGRRALAAPGADEDPRRRQGDGQEQQEAEGHQGPAPRPRDLLGADAVDRGRVELAPVRLVLGAELRVAEARVDVAEDELVPVGQALLGHLLGTHAGPVGAAEIPHRDPGPVEDQLGVVSGDGGVGHRDRVVRLAAQGRAALLESYALALPSSTHEEQGVPVLHGIRLWESRSAVGDAPAPGRDRGGRARRQP